MAIEKICEKSRILKLDGLGINYLEEINIQEKDGIAMEPYYFSGKNINLILSGFNIEGFNPKNTNLKKKILKIIANEKDDFPLEEINEMGIDQISYSDCEDFINKVYLSMKEFEKEGRPEKILEKIKIKRIYNKFN